MAYEVILDPEAAAQLDEIVEYLSTKLSSAAAAANFVDKFDELVGRLETMPHSFPRSNDYRLQIRGYRKALIGNYLVLFKVIDRDKQSGTVYVTNLFHGSQNYQEMV